MFRGSSSVCLSPCPCGSSFLFSAPSRPFFADGLFFNTRTLIWDSADQYFPFLNLASRLWRSGHVPLWNPFLYNGYPLIGEPQYQTFYPINLLISHVAAFTPRTLMFQVALHQLLGGVFTFLLAGLWMESTPARSSRFPSLERGWPSNLRDGN